VRAGDVIDQPSQGEHFLITRSAIHEDGPLQFEWTVQPRASGPPRHMHPHDHEILRVLEGCARVELDGEIRLVEAGSSIRLPAGVPHQVRNGGDVPMCVLVTSDDGVRFERLLDVMSEGGFAGFAKLAQFLGAHPDTVRQSGRAMRAFMWTVAGIGRLAGHRYVAADSSATEPSMVQ